MKKTIYTREYKQLVAKLAKARQDAGYDQIKTAKLLKRSQSYISKVETGQLRLDAIQLKEFAKLYGKPIAFFLK